MAKPDLTRFRTRAGRPPSEKKPRKLGPGGLAFVALQVNLKSDHSGGKKDEKHSQKRGTQQSFYAAFIDFQTESDLAHSDHGHVVVWSARALEGIG